MLAKAFLIVISAILTGSGSPASGMQGVCLDTEKNGKVTFDTAGTVEEPFTYISYKGTGADPGDTVYTVLFYGDTGEPDDIIKRVDFVKGDK